MDQILNQLVGTAVTSRQFEALLLSNPAKAAVQFGLPHEVMEAVAAIQATTISDFASQLDVWMAHRRNGNGNGHKPVVPFSFPVF